MINNGKGSQTYGKHHVWLAGHAQDHNSFIR
jgi:hypothetical protein